ncbi:hypothetical protein [Kibdelosporangium phytohabitans]|nr:hypothetical protein [Kibdelosporangium phytohabitans]MBE1461085.1 hypothetical protein [Kibdelosporangium phytohabitans]
MAVTRQLARIPEPQLTGCRAPVEELDRLCSFQAASQRDYLDLNWWGIVLASLGKHHPSLAVLDQALRRVEAVNPAYRDHHDTIAEHPATAWRPREVSRFAEGLRALTPSAISDALPSDQDAVEVPGTDATDVDGDLAHHLVEQFGLMRDFYGEAADRHLAVVLWWD